MLRWSLGIVVAAASLVHAGLALASAAGEPPARPGMFAARSATLARRLTAEQREEWRFLKEAAAASQFGAQAARMALARSSDPSVRSLAATLANHHASVQTALGQMLHARNMAPPMLSSDQRKSLNHLARLQGAKFDCEWMQAVALDSQQEGVQAFERAAPLVQAPALRSWIARTLASMRYQLGAAQRTAGSGDTRFARLAPPVTSAMIKSPALSNPADLGQGNMLLGPAQPVAIRLTEPNNR
jgi:putative membrane protein